MSLIKDLKYSYDPKTHDFLGITRAQVVCNNDPKKIGRIQVRIPSYHGVPNLTDRVVKDEDLPWAMPCFYGGSGQDMGSFLVPIPGSYVWLLFEDNDVEKPIYLGGVPGIGSELSKVMNNINDPESPQQPWNTKPNEPDVPKDEFDKKTTGVPERGIIYKSQKGHTIMFDDTDEEESMTFLDRIGQMIKFFCGITKGKNGEGYKRELTSAETDDQLGEAYVEEPSIMIRSGEAKDQPKLHSMFRMYRDHMRTECIDADADKHTSTDYDPLEYNQETQTSILNMTEDHIFFDYKENMIHEEFCDDSWSLKAFDVNLIECTKDHLHISYKENGIFIDDKEIKIKFNGTTMTLDEKNLAGNAPEEFSFKSSGANFKGNEDGISGDGKEVSLSGSGTMYTKEGKTYMSGSEIHFTKG